MNEQSQKQFATPVPGVSVAQLVKNIGIKEVGVFDPKYTNYLRSFCSELSKETEFFDRKYSVKKLEGKTEVSWELKF